MNPAIFTLLLIFNFAQGEQSVGWLSPDIGFNLSEENNKIVMVYFYTDWCLYCKQMEREVFTEKEIIESLSNYYIPVKMNPEKDQKPFKLGDVYYTPEKLAKEAGAESFPYFAFFRNGRLFGYLKGYYPKKDFIKILNNL